MIVDFSSKRNKINKDLVGAKFYNLFLLKNDLNLPIPDSFCITDRQYDRSDLIQRIETGQKYAVRSSSNQEDSSEGSAAGMFTTFLNQEGYDQIERSITACFDSVYGSEINEYLLKKEKENEVVNMSVIIQKMVQPEEAGVLFTLNPVTGQEEYVVESIRGLAEQILDGTGTPNRIILKKADTRDNKIYAVLKDSADQIKKYFGQPQDIEWAYSGRKLYILQTRPITSKNMNEDLSRQWTRANIGEILPHPLTPLSWDVFEKVIFSSYRFGYYAFHDWVLMNLVHLIPREWPKTKSPRLFNGYAYLNFETIQLTFSFEPWVDHEVLNIGLGFDLSSEKRKEPKFTTKLIRAIKKTEYLFEIFFTKYSFEKRGLENVKRQLQKINGTDPEKIFKRASLVFGWHIAATARGFSSLGYLMNRQKEKFSAQIISDKLSAIKDSAFIAELKFLVGLAQSNPNVLNKIENSELDTYQKWEECDEFINALNKFFVNYGYKSDNEFELSQKSWQELPNSLKDMLKTKLNFVDSTGTQKDHYENKYLKLSDSFNLREDLKNLLVREYREFRIYYLNLGIDLNRAGVLDDPEDIFFLHLHEIENEDLKSRNDIKNIVKKRRIDHNLVREKKVPFTFYGESPDEQETEPDLEQNNYLKGVGCSAGIITAKSVHIERPEEGYKLLSGDILVTQATNPGWTPLFARAGGVVTEIGGMLSHTATIAREYNIPMITGINDIMTQIPDGRNITIDGKLGTVKIQEE